MCLYCKVKKARIKFCSSKCKHKHQAETRKLRTQLNKVLKKEYE